MKKLASLSILFLITFKVFAIDLSSIKSYGYYIEGKDGLIKLEPYGHSYMEFKYLHEVMNVVRQDKSLALLVYQKDFDVKNNKFKLQEMALPGAYKDLSFDVEPTEKDDMYWLRYAKPIANNQVVMIMNGWGDKGALSVLLGDTENVVETVFSDMTIDANAAYQYLQELAPNYPQNKVIQGLIPKWKARYIQYFDDKDYARVDAHWLKYKKQKKLAGQRVWLKRVVGDGNYYLEKHAEGSHADTVKQRIAYSTKKITEINQQI